MKLPAISDQTFRQRLGISCHIRQESVTEMILSVKYGENLNKSEYFQACRVVARGSMLLLFTHEIQALLAVRSRISTEKVSSH